MPNACCIALVRARALCATNLPYTLFSTPPPHYTLKLMLNRNVNSSSSTTLEIYTRRTNWRKKLAEFSTQFRDQCKTFRTVSSGAHKGEKFCVVFRYLPSLKAMGLPMYTVYTEEERALHRRFLSSDGSFDGFVRRRPCHTIAHTTSTSICFHRRMFS